MIRRFRQRAPSRTAHAPDQEDLIGWLFLAQHYGLPTRLLDWTELPLVATLFAVCGGGHAGETGVLFALDPARSNHRMTGQSGILPAIRSDVFPLFQRPFDETKPESAKILAVLATEVDLRMMVQRSAFTIHGADARPLDQSPNAAEFLLRFEIPPAAKSGIREGLERLGVRWSNVFPDLEHLAKETEETKFVQGEAVQAGDAEGEEE